VELEFLELDERDARAANPMMPGLSGMKIYFTKRPEIELTLWIGGFVDLIGIPLIGWIIQKLVVDNIVCYSTKLGPTFEGQKKMDIGGNDFPIKGDVAKTLDVAKILKLKARDRKRNAEADMDASMSMACRLVARPSSATTLPDGSIPYCILMYGSTEQLEMEEPPAGVVQV
jgi:hypothetical protein